MFGLEDELQDEIEGLKHKLFIQPIIGFGVGFALATIIFYWTLFIELLH